MVGTRSSFSGRRWRGEQVEAPADGDPRPSQSPRGALPVRGSRRKMERGSAGEGGGWISILTLDDARGKVLGVSLPPPASRCAERPVPPEEDGASQGASPPHPDPRRAAALARAPYGVFFPQHGGSRAPLSPGREGSAAPAPRPAAGRVIAQPVPTGECLSSR